MAYLHLGEMLINAGIITKEQLEQGIALQKGTNERLGTVLINNGIITEKQLIEVLRMQLGIEFIDLTRVSIPTEMAQALPKNIGVSWPERIFSRSNGSPATSRRSISSMSLS